MLAVRSYSAVQRAQFIHSKCNAKKSTVIQSIVVRTCRVSLSNTSASVRKGSRALQCLSGKGVESGSCQTSSIIVIERATRVHGRLIDQSAVICWTNPV
jgi:hypothetical protein